MDSQVILQAPENHVIMLSVPQMDVKITCYEDRLDITWVQDGQQQRRRYCGSHGPPPTLYSTRVVSLHFVSTPLSPWTYPGPERYGFRLLFSFHSINTAPQKIDQGQWNCSVPHFPDFRPHLACNLEVACLAGEDEEGCPYPPCQSKGVTIGNGCYVVVPIQKASLRMKARFACQELGGYIASYNTQKEREDVEEAFMSNNFATFRLHEGVIFEKGVPPLYRSSLFWEDKTIVNIAVSEKLHTDLAIPLCSKAHAFHTIDIYSCTDINRWMRFICELESNSEKQPQTQIESVSLEALVTSETLDSLIACPQTHLTQSFLACDSPSACWSAESVDFADEKDIWDIPSFSTCSAPGLTSLPPSFACSGGAQRVPYTLVCDYRQDCQDNSDEDFCNFPPCGQDRSLQCGNSQQCISETGWCDHSPDCVNDWDELDCDVSEFFQFHIPPMPVKVLFPKGRRRLESIADISLCPDTHFRCPGDEFCMPVFVRCNGVYDCPGREDEVGCSSYTCPGFYRCRASTVCLHPDDVCDKVYQCPQWDDELLCDLKCPEKCTCHGLAFRCSDMFTVQLYPELRYLNGAGSGLTPAHLVNHVMLIHLSLADCGLTRVGRLTFPNLHSIDLSDNLISDVSVEHLRHLTHLRALFLAGNPLTSLFSTNISKPMTFSDLHTLDLSNVVIENLNTSVFASFSGLQTLNLTDCGVQRISTDGFQSLENLRELYTFGCPLINFQPEIFNGLTQLETVHAENYRLCCPVVLPAGNNLIDCQAPYNEISSCDDLLRSSVYRIFLTIFATLTIAGNTCSFLFRLLYERSIKRTGFAVFVANLCVSDFLMGVYLAMIGLADHRFRGSYLWKDVIWRQSVLCQTAGVVCLVSSEVSAFLICLITLDRFLVLRFPFSPMHFRSKSAMVACAGVWTVGLVLATLPLLPALSHWHFYSNTGICVPLPVTRSDFAGHGYAFAIMIVVNFVLFVLIAAGQISIFLSVRTNSMIPSDVSRKSQDLNIARRLITIALSDFLCWFPIGLLGLLAARGTPVSGDVNVGMAIFVLPLNSAINPFLYTVNVILEQTRKRRDDKILKLIQHDLKWKRNITNEN